MEIFLFSLEIIGTIAFAVGGSVLAIKHKMDVLGVIILGIIASLGGGLLRDIMFNKLEIVLFDTPIYVSISIITSLIIFIIFYCLKNISILDNEILKHILNIIDGIGLGVFVVIGINSVYDVTNNILLIGFSGLITAVGGGVIRDLMVNRIPNIFRKHIYAVAALFGCIIYLIFCYYNLSLIGSLITILIVTIIRILSHQFKFSLPKINIE